MSQAMVPAKERMDSLRSLFDKARPAIADVLPRHLTPDRLIRVTLAAVSRTPLLLQCTPQSILQGVMVASQLGLEPTGVLGSAYLVPYKNNKTGNYEAQLIPGYRGLIDLARRSGQIVSIESHVVYENDKFTYKQGLAPTLDHEPTMGEPGKMIAVYAVAHLTGGGSQFEVMTKAEVDKIRSRSRAGQSGPWVSDYDEMARKTVIRRLAKYLPVSVEFATGLQLQADAEAGEVTDYGTIVDLPEEFIEADEIQTRTETVKDKIKAATGNAKTAIPSGLITAEQKANLADAIEDCNAPDYVWSLVSVKFDAPTYEDIATKQYDDVMKFIAEHRESIAP